MRVGIIDLGTNSIRFDLQEFRPGGAVRRLHREKIMVRLGQGVFLSGKLDPRASETTLQSLRSFSLTAEAFHVDRIVGFGTSALREATDASSFLKRVKRETGIEIRVISGEEEARLIARGILENEKLPKGRFALIDIGGGSTEITVCEGKKILRSASFPLGVARLQQLFVKNGIPDQAIRKHIKRVIEAKFSREKWPKAQVVLGSSGTAQALLRIEKKKHHKNVQSISMKSLKRWVKVLSGKTPLELLKIPGMEPKRVDLIAVGAILMEECMSELKSQKLTATEFSLRDGILEEEWARVSHRSYRENLELTLDAARSKLAKMGFVSVHTDQVYSLSLELFDRLKKIHKLGPEWKKILGISVLLHDVGEGVSALDHAEHSAYIAKHSDLPGITREDLEIVAEICRYHSGKRVPEEALPFRYQKKLLRAFRFLLALLRIADGMDRGHRGILKIHSISILPKKVVIRVKAKENIDLELFRLESKKELFQEVSKKKVEIRWLKGRSR